MHLKSGVPLVCNSFSQLQAAVSRTNADYLEIYLDFVASGPTLLSDLDQLKSILKQTSALPIITLRRPKFSTPALTLNDRHLIIDRLVDEGVLFDFDVLREQPEIEYLLRQKNPEKHLVASYHDYEKTPPDAEVRAIIAGIKAKPFYALKFAGLAQNHEDHRRLCGLALELSRDQNVSRWIVSPMGVEFGKSGRIVAALLGSLWTYVQPPAHLGLAGTAPGQISFEEFETLKSICRR